MNSMPLSLEIQVFVCAAAFGALINMYSVQILKTFWSKYAYGDRTSLPWATGNSVVQALLGRRTIHYMKSRMVLFPWFELTFASLVLLALIVHGLNWQFVRTAAFLTFALPLATISALDERNGALTPHILTIPGTALGLVTSWLPGSMRSISPGMLDDVNLPVGLSQAIEGLASSLLGSAAGYLVLYIVYLSFRLLTGKEGMNYGCFTANMMIGAFCGWQLLPVVIVISSSIASVVGIWRILIKHIERDTPQAFTPYQMLAGIIAMIWGYDLVTWYLSLVSRHDLGTTSHGPFSAL